MPKRNRSENLIGSRSLERGTLTRALDTDTFKRILKRRLEDCDALGDELIETIIAGINAEALEDEKTAKGKFEHIVRFYFRVASNAVLPPEKRRLAWNTVSDLLRQVDSLLERKIDERDPSSDANTSSLLSGVDLSATSERRRPSKRPSVMATHPALQRLASNQTIPTSPATSSKTTIAAASERQTEQSQTAATTAGEKRNQRTPRVHPALQKHPSMHPALQNGGSANNDPSQPKKSSTGKPIHPSLQNNSSLQVGMVIHDNSAPTSLAQEFMPPTTPNLASTSTVTDKDAPTANGQTNTNNSVILSNPTKNLEKTKTHVIPVEKGLVEKPLASTYIDFPSDQNNSPYSRALQGRDAIRVTFRHVKDISASTHEEVVMRLSTWEPYWEIERILCFGYTSKIDVCKASSSRKNVPPETVPKTVASFSIDENLLQRNMIDAVKNWGKDGGTPIDGEYRLLLRFLPKDPKDNKKKRADCHLWPKGTFLTLNGNPITIDQRRQQSHNHLEWKGMSKHLDLGKHINAPSQMNKIGICCVDPDQYYFTLALCKYRSPATLVNQLLTSNKLTLEWLSLEDSVKKAKSFTSQAVVLDDDEDDDSDNTDIAKFVFSLIDPISKVPMKIPVRGRSCKHWQVCTGTIFCITLGHYALTRFTIVF